MLDTKKSQEGDVVPVAPLLCKQNGGSGRPSPSHDPARSSNRPLVSAGAMPNGDPPSLILWGEEEDKGMREEKVISDQKSVVR